MLFLLAQEAGHNTTRNMLDAVARTPLSIILMIVAGWTIVRLALFPKLIKTAPHLRSGSYVAANVLTEIADAIIYAAVFVFLLIRPFAIQTFTIPTGSMLDTLQLNDFIIANKFVYRYSEPEFGDIVVFKPPEHGKPVEEQGNDMDYIKRCRGVPGDLIEVRNGLLYRNGEQVSEPFVKYDPGADRMRHDFKLVKYKGEYWPLTWQPGELPNLFTPIGKFRVDDPSVGETLSRLPAEKIPPGHFLMMGDNRENSSDGRFWGLISREAIVGKSMVVWWPPPRWGVTR